MPTFAQAMRDAMSSTVDPLALDQTDTAMLDVAAPVVDAACRAWFGLEVHGTEHLPAGAALVVGNHNSGITFLEALGWGARLHLEGVMQPPWLALTHDGVLSLPGVGPFLVRCGAVRASPAVATRALRSGRKVVVFPGGNPEAFRPWKERKRVDLQGRRGFVRLALRHGVPIVPVAFYGGHDGFFVVAENRWLARGLGAKRLLRTEVWPLVVGLPWGVSLGPWFHLPLPVKCITRFLPPIDVSAYPAEAADDPEVVERVYAQVERALQEGMDALAAEVPRPLTGARARLRQSTRQLVSGLRRNL